MCALLIIIMTMIDDYLSLQDQYEKKYGEKTIVLYECGQFFEIYGVVNDQEKSGRIYEKSDLTNLSVSKKGSKYAPISRKNPLMAGFPNHSYEKWKNILLKHNYTIIKIEQDSHGTKNPKRAVTEIISPGLNVESHSFNNYLLSIYLEESTYKNKPILLSGVSTIDITTGENIIYEIKSKPDDYNYVLDELFRFIRTYNPAEIIINTENLSLTENYVIKYLEIEGFNLHYNNYKQSKYLLENKYRKKLLDKLFPNHGLLCAEEYLDINHLPFGTSSYIFLLQFSYDHNETVIHKLTKPKIWQSNDYLILSYDSISQLNVLPDKNLKTSSKYDSLWSLLDKTSTTLGRRFLRESLLNPILDPIELNKRYRLIELLLSKHNGCHIYSYIENYLQKIFDIERLHRRMTIGLLEPKAFTNLDISYQFIIQLIDFITNSITNEDLLSILPQNNTILQFKEFINDYTSKLNMEIVSRFTQNNIKTSIFRDGLYPKIDQIQIKIQQLKLFFTNLRKYFSEITGLDFKSIELKETDKEGHFISLTKNRGQLLKDKLKDIKTINIKIDNDNTITINVSELNFRNLSTTSKITCPEIKKYSEKLNFQYSKLSKKCLIQFKELLSEYDKKYSKILNNVVHFISYIDFVKSNSKCTIQYNYHRPYIKKSELNNSYIKADNLRHPIIEKINDSIEYIPNDVTIGTDNKNGMLLFGVNAVGKSSYMKAMGLSIIMAQSGMYVPAENYHYHPYKNLFTRISGNDNIFKGQSTFAVEMSELRSILKRADNNSLILGDELCSGTETTSGLAIVASGVISLNKIGSSFIFATHLHQLSNMNRILELKNVNYYHMETIFDQSTGSLIYNRKIKNGSGNAIYGLEVAKAMDLDPEFIQMANTIRQEIMGIKKNIVNRKTSQYNASIIIDSCQICQKDTEEVHHIKAQEIANENNMIEHHHKNVKHNLIQLCHQCHQDVHHGNLVIKGYIQTSNGKKVDYYREEKKKKIRKKKFNKEQVEIILSYKEITNSTKSQAIRLLELNNQLKVSNNIVNQIWNNSYL